jgi:hypothetical protein
MSFYPDCIARCQHIKINGTQCGSPALRRNRFCYFHKRWSDQRIRINSRARNQSAAFDLPVLEDANSIQVALMQVMRLLASHQLDHKTAGLLLYALQTASVNLRHTDFEPRTKTRVVINPKDVSQTPLEEDPWDPSQFEEADQEEIEAPTPQSDAARTREILQKFKDQDAKEDGLEIQAVADVGADVRSVRARKARPVVARHRGRLYLLFVGRARRHTQLERQGAPSPLSLRQAALSG